MRKSLAAGAACTIVLAACPGLAAEADRQPAASPSAKIEEVVVTSRKRAESVQKVPATIQVVDRKAIARAGISSVTQLAQVAPGVVIQQAPTANDVGVTIRGLGSAPGALSFDSSVSLFVNGVYSPRTSTFNASLFDVDRVEVIRGTQAALLGKNTSLGAVDVVTRKPGSVYAADIGAQYEFALHSTVVNGAVDLPFLPNLRVRLAGIYADEGGWVRNEVTGNAGTAAQRHAERVTLAWDPREDVDVTAVYQHGLGFFQGSPTKFVETNGLPAALAALAGYSGFAALGDLKTAVGDSRAPDGKNSRISNDFASASVNWHLDGYTLTSQTGFVGNNQSTLDDVDFQPGDYLFQNTQTNSHQITEEVRLTSPAEQRLSYIVGGLFLDNRLRDNVTLTGNYPAGIPAPVPLTGTETTFFYQKNRAWSAFAQGTLRLFDGLRAVGGIRYTNEDKSADLARAVLDPGVVSLAIFPPYAPFTLSRSESVVDGSFALQYQLRPNTLAYVSWAQGTKSGGFANSVTALPGAGYAPETARTVEVGVKHQSEDRRLTVNAAAFHTEVTDYQLVTFTGLAFLVDNTDLESDGIESEVNWLPLDNLRLTWNSTYADAYDTRTGHDVPRAPRWTGLIGATYTAALDDRRQAEVTASWNYRSSETQQQDPYAVPRSASFDTLNVTLSLADTQAGWTARLIARNLTDRRAAAFAFPTPILPPRNSIIVPEQPRTIALQLTKHF